MDDLLALAESLECFEDGSISATEDTSETTPDAWKLPPKLILRTSCSKQHSSLELIHPQINEEYATRDSPVSPTQKNRVSLFTESDDSIDLIPTGESSDPRCLYIMDHPGRNAQFKHWYSAGLIHDDSRRATFRDEHSIQGCWISAQATDIGNKNAATILNLIRGIRTDESERSPLKQDPTSSPQTLSGLGQQSTGSQIREIWDTRSFVVGSSLVVTMAKTGLDDTLIRSWCVWFNDRLCTWGLNDKPGSHPDVKVSGNFVADLDFSSNNLTDSSVIEIVRLLGAFKRIHVLSLRLGSNSLTGTMLDSLKELPYLKYLVLDNNHLMADDLLRWFPELLASKQERYDILVAQDIPDESVRDPVYLSVENNNIFQPQQLVERFKQAGILVCIPETSGCEPNQSCRILGDLCDVHFGGLTTQKNPSYV